MVGRHRRDFLLDSGAVSALASDETRLRGYLRVAALQFDGAILIPVPVLTEVRSGRRRTDVQVDRLLAAIGPGESVFAPLTITAASRAGVLRASAQRGRRRPISAIDAQIVAIAEERSFGRAITIVTGDARDIRALDDVTGRPNIAVETL